MSDREGFGVIRIGLAGRVVFVGRCGLLCGITGLVFE